MALIMVACQKEDNGTLRLEVEHYTGDAKAHLDNNYAVWDNGDPIKVNGINYTVAVDDNAQTATITGVPASETGYKAIYPARLAGPDCSTITYDKNQTYHTQNGNQVIDAPMVAHTAAGSDVLSFKNIGSILAVNVSSDIPRVRKIEVIAANGTLINGTANIDFTGGRPAMGTLSGGTNTITLNCSSNGYGVAIPSEGKTFYIAIPPVTAQLTIKVYGDVQSYSRSQNGDFTLSANHGYNVPFSTAGLTPELLTAPLPNQIWYTSSNSVIVPNNIAFFGATLVSNEYNEALQKYIITFDSPLLAIGPNAFLNCRSLTSIDLPAILITIEQRAFSGCRSLTSIDLPSNVTIVREGAFYDCRSLSSITLPRVTDIGGSAFYDCRSLTSIALPKVTDIGGSAFAECSRLASITLPKAITIGENAFLNCGSLATIDLPASLTTVGYLAFSGCDDLVHIYYRRDSPPNSTPSDCGFQPEHQILYIPKESDLEAWLNWWNSERIEFY